MTADAAHWCRETAQAIRERDADALLHLKAHRGAAYEVAMGYFQAARADDFAGVQVRHSRTEEAAHGRIESREAVVDSGQGVRTAGGGLALASEPDLRRTHPHGGAEDDV